MVAGWRWTHDVTEKILEDDPASLFSIKNSHRIHVWYICLHEWLIFMVNVGTYMDPMGLNGTESQRTPWPVSCDRAMIDTQVFSGSVSPVGPVGPISWILGRLGLFSEAMFWTEKCQGSGKIPTDFSYLLGFSFATKTLNSMSGSWNWEPLTLPRSIKLSFTATCSFEDGWNHAVLFWALQVIFIPYGCFQKQEYPQIIHCNRVFHYKPSILRYHYFWKHLYRNHVRKVSYLGKSLLNKIMGSSGLIFWGLKSMDFSGSCKGW